MTQNTCDILRSGLPEDLFHEVAGLIDLLSNSGNGQDSLALNLVEAFRQGNRAQLFQTLAERMDRAVVRARLEKEAAGMQEGKLLALRNKPPYNEIPSANASPSLVPLAHQTTS